MRVCETKGNSVIPPCREKKGGKAPRQRARARTSSLSLAEVRLVAVHHAFYPRAHCEAIVHRTSHPVPVPMTSAMGIFTRESLIPPWESSLTSGGDPRILRHIWPMIRLDYIFRNRDTTRSFVPPRWRLFKREEYAGKLDFYKDFYDK